MKKLFILMFCMILLVGTVSAWEWDNVKSYNEETKTMTIVNALGLGDNIAKIQLLTPLDNHVPLGYGEVARFEVTQFSDYNNALKELELLDKRKGDKKFLRDYDYKVLTLETKEYKIVSQDWYTGEDVITYENKTIEVWTKLNETNFKKDNVLIIGIFTEVKLGDKVEWIPNIMGVRIDEWAVWTEDLNVELNHYYTLDNVNDSLLTANMTIVGSPVFEAGLIGDNINLGEGENPGNFLTISDDWGINASTPKMCLNGWINVTNTPTANENVIISTRNDANDVQYSLQLMSSPNRLQFDRSNLGVGGITASSSFTIPVDGPYHMITGCDDGINLMLYFGAVLVDSVTTSTANGTGSFATLSRIGESPQTAGRDFDGKVDEVGVWARNLTLAEIVQLNNSGFGITFTDKFPPSVTLDSPVNFFNTSNASIIFGATINNINNLPNDLVNATLEVFHNNGSLLLTDIINITGSANVSNFTKTIPIGDNYLWNIITADNNSLVGRAILNNTFSIKSVILNSVTFNSSTFETSNELFIINITTNGTAPTSASLIYAGTEFTGATITSFGENNYNISKTIGVPLGAATNQFHFNFSIGSDEIKTIDNSQNVSLINFTLCSAAPQDVAYINLTFKNETINEESLNATIVSTWIYSLSDVGVVNKTLSFSNSSESSGYDFCFNPSNRTLNIDLLMNYNNVQSQQRTFSLITALTNLTTSQVLYLLPTSLGLFSPFQVVDNIGNPLSNVRGLITRILGSSTITVSSAFTDDSGFVSYFLNPEVTYTGSFSKAGFTTETFTFTPTSDTRTVILGGGTGVIANGTSILTNTTYTITPTNRTLTNGTNYLFSFNVSSSEAITFISMNITSNGTSHLFVSNAGDGFISGIVNTGENSSFVGYFVMKTADETFSLASIWIIDQTFIGDYSLFKQMVLFNEYEFTDFIRLLISLVLILSVMIFVNNIGISDDSESKIAIALLLVWALSIVGWLNTGIISASGSSNIQNLAQFSNQFGIAILSTGAGLYFILRRVFT